MNFICGINPVLEALAAGTRHFDRLLVVKGLRNKRIAEAMSRASRLGVPLRFESRETLDRISGGVPHQGLIAVVSEKPLMELDELLTSLRDPALLMALDGVEDPRNLGAILRSCEAAGADGVLLPQRRTAGLSEVVGRASAGALEYVRVARIGNLAQALETLKARGVWVVGFDASGRERWDAVDLKRPVALVMGGEGRGIRRLVRERCDHVVALPMFGHVGSLNVAVAAGIALYEVVRQRGLVPSHVRPIAPGDGQGASPRVFGPGVDDEELDPGDLRPAGMRLDPASVGGGDDPDEPPEAMVHIQEEETAWSGPQMMRSKARARTSRFQERPGRRGGDGKGKRRGGPRPAPPQRATAPPSSPARPDGHAGAAEGPREKKGRRRRRGRGSREAGAPGAGSAPTAGERRDERASDDVGRDGAGNGAPEGAPPTGSATGPDERRAPGSARRRRRRRPRR